MKNYDLKDILTIVFILIAGLVVANHHLGLEIDALSGIEQVVFSGEERGTEYFNYDVAGGGCANESRGNGAAIKSVRMAVVRAERNGDMQQAQALQERLDVLLAERSAVCD
jgi:hypothetical protein